MAACLMPDPPRPPPRCQKLSPGPLPPSVQSGMRAVDKPRAPVVYPQGTGVCALSRRVAGAGPGRPRHPVPTSLVGAPTWHPATTQSPGIGSGKVGENCEYAPVSRPKRLAVPPPGGDTQVGTGCRVPGMVKSCQPERFTQPRVWLLVPHRGWGPGVGAPPSPSGTFTGRFRFNAHTSTGGHPPMAAQGMCSHQWRHWPAVKP